MHQRDHALSVFCVITLWLKLCNQVEVESLQELLSKVCCGQQIGKVLFLQLCAEGRMNEILPDGACFS